MTKEEAQRRLYQLRLRIEWHKDVLRYYRIKSCWQDRNRSLHIIAKSRIKINQLMLKYFFGEKV